MKNKNRNLVYIDGFAGPGHYTDDTGVQQPGSPIRALSAIAATKGVAGKVSTFFIEKDPVLYGDLEHSVTQFHLSNPGIRKPQVANAPFGPALLSAFEKLEEQGKKLAPGFLFVDPCGVAGTDFNAITRFLQEKSSEALIFFNLDGVRRIVGLGDRARGTLPCLLGSERRAADLIAQVGRCKTSLDRETTILNFYKQALIEETSARFVTLFRVEKESLRSTSHYLVHVTSHPLGFRIMKDVMWGLGETNEGPGAFALQQASIDDQVGLFPRRDRLARDIVRKVLTNGMKKVDYITTTLPEHPRVLVASTHFKEVLLDMEAKGELEVLDKSDGSTVMPATKRPKRKGKVTLGKGYLLRLTK